MQEALLLTVWLRRQEQEVRKVAVMAWSGNPENAKGLMEAYKQFVDSAFPFAATSRTASDQQLVDAMKKEASKGAIGFTPIETGPSPLQKAATKLRLPDEFRQKLQQNQRARKRA